MNHEIFDPETAITTGQLRIPKQLAIARHIAQYETRSMHDGNARQNCIKEIERQLLIKENDVPYHGRDEINLTLMLIDDERSDLAKELWTRPEQFCLEHTELVALGLQKVDVILNHHHISKSDLSVDKKWQRALKKCRKRRRPE